MKNFENEGLLGEADFLDFLGRTRTPYFGVAQSPQTLAPQFHGKAKRPDVIVASKARLAAIDIKRKKPGFWAGPTIACVGLNTSEIEKLLVFERLTGAPAFIAFFDGWNAARRDLWRIAKISALAPIRKCDSYILLDINALTLVSSRASLMAALQ